MAQMWSFIAVVITAATVLAPAAAGAAPPDGEGGPPKGEEPTKVEFAEQGRPIDPSETSAETQQEMDSYYTTSSWSCWAWSGQGSGGNNRYHLYVQVEWCASGGLITQLAKNRCQQAANSPWQVEGTCATSSGPNGQSYRWLRDFGYFSAYNGTIDRTMVFDANVYPNGAITGSFVG